MRGRVRRSVVLCVGMVIAVSCRARAGVPTVEAGAIELGLSGSVQSVDETRTVNAAISLARYFAWRSQLVFVRAATEYGHVGELDLVELATALGFMLRAPDSPTLPFVAARIGIRQEWLGSFSQARYPLGLELGLRLMTSRSSAVAFAYQYRRILDDPVADYNEHRFIFGLSLFFQNSGGAR